MKAEPRSALATAAAVLDGALSPEDLVREALGRIDAENGVLRAVVTTDPEDSLRQADHLAHRLAAGERPPLAGVPIVVKDAIWVAGWRVTQGSRLYADFVAPADNVAVTRLRHAGAIVVGMANMSEFGCKGVTSNPLHGTTRHPLDPRLTPGGSSGGCASALGADLVPLGLGTDGGGSARRPAAHVGIVGFKPSGGLVADGPGFEGGGSRTSVLAPMGRSVADVGAMFDVLLGADRVDPLSVALPTKKDGGRLRIAYAPTFGLGGPVDASVETSVATALETLRAAGFDIIRFDPVWPTGAGEAALMPLQWAGLAKLHGARWQSEPTLFDPYIAAQIAKGLAQSDADVGAARAMAVEILEATQIFFAAFDLVIGPTTPCTAWPHDLLGPTEIDGQPVHDRAHAAFTPFFNHALAAAISIPCGVDRRGLPIGLQIVGPRFADRRVLTMAAAAERLLTATQPGG
ncbi:amidase [Lichenihabitans sp. Uapishka_5]|uniref:amidase n=1 Tax=Lichenihabitans sp. Uapishka_5 TaxID=3037302 RepID=UPI0029E7EB00|nr:amidase [Lichenihabitans sp. Uapishka_5]MDX7950280.1 amidase [Lichenihabitans sp. Uapishka_5]